MNNVTDLNNHFYGSASKGFLATKSKIGDFMQPICRKDKKRIRKKLEKIMMLQNLSDSPPPANHKNFRDGYRVWAL